MSKKEIITSEKFKIYGRMAFLKLDEPKKFNGTGVPRWEATCILDPADAKGLESIKLCIKTAVDVAKRSYGGVVPLDLRKLAAIFIPGQAAPDIKAKEDGIEVAFFNGDKKSEQYPEYEGKFIVPAHNAKMKPGVANRRGVSVSPGDEGFPYSGCYGWMSLTLWGQDNDFGKRVGINLRGVQFAKDGEAFAQGDVVAEEEFEALEDTGAEGGDDIGFE